MDFSTHHIDDLIPHRHPFLFLDKILKIENRKRAIGIKNVTISDPFMQGHFPSQPVMPGSIIIEVISQTATAIFFKDPNFAGQYPIYNEIKSAVFKKPVHPGDQLRAEVTVKKMKDNLVTIEGLALVDGRVVAEVTLHYTFAPKPTRPQIHPTASVHTSATLGKDVVVGPYTKVGENVIIGDGTILEANVMIEAGTVIGEECHIYFGTVIGSSPQDIKFKDDKSGVIIGDRNKIREYVTINRATGDNESTEIGSDCFIMTGVHIGHNCRVGNNVTIVNTTGVSGHVIIEDFVTIGGVAGIHQFVRIGKGAMVGGYARIVQDVPPFMLCEGHPASVRNINAVGLKRQGYSMTDVKEIKAIFKELYRSDKNLSQALDAIKGMALTSKAANDLITFIKADSKRGLTLKGKAKDE